MKMIAFQHHARHAKALTIAAAVSFALAGCATAPVSPDGAASVRSKLTELQSDPRLADRAPVAIREAEAAVRVAEEPLADDAALGAHRVYMADRKVEIAMAQVSTRYSEDQRSKLGDERERARLAARTREADMATADAAAARASAADAARGAADAARSAALQADELQRQIDALQAEATNRGLVLTLGDVLFESGRAELKVGAVSNLTRLVVFLNQNPDRNVEIEGHTDNLGSNDYNQELSQRRADSVKSYLVQQGIGSERIMASGKGESQPITDNVSASGRQQNRRVEVIIDNPPAAIAST